MKFLSFLIALLSPLIGQCLHTLEECAPLRELLNRFEIPLEQAVPETQKLWLQKGKERWEFDGRFEEMRDAVWPLFEEMELFSEVEPKSDGYDYALLLGALLPRVEQRLAFLSDLCKRGVQFREIVFLTGDRPLLDWERDATGCSNESEMARWAHSRSAVPKEIPAVFIDASKTPAGRRPQTADTVLAWLKTGPREGSCLAISNQPYVAYQHAVLKSLLPREFSVDAAGPAAQKEPSVALLLDTIAKELFWLDPK
jgi:hypothetical protein